MFFHDVDHFVVLSRYQSCAIIKISVDHASIKIYLALIVISDEVWTQNWTEVFVQETLPRAVHVFNELKLFAIRCKAALDLAIFLL